MRKVPLSGRKAGGRVALVDDADFDLVSRYSWRVWERTGTRLPAGPYAVTTVTVNGWTRQTISMHQMLTGWAETDHKDHSGLNCQRSNLREVTSALNSANRRKAPGWSSRFKGVSWSGGKWRAQIGSGGRTIHLGTYSTESAAAQAYDDAAWLLWGKYACLNQVPGLQRLEVLTLF